MESIKHVFDVDNVQFVLVTNSNQLRASINHCYGKDIDSQRYLDKFVGFSFSLPNAFKPDRHRSALVSVHHLEGLIRESESLRDFFRAKDAVLSFLKSQRYSWNSSISIVNTQSFLLTFSSIKSSSFFSTEFDC